MNIVAELKRIAAELNDEEYYGYLIYSTMSGTKFSYISKNKELALDTANEAIKAIEDSTEIEKTIGGDDPLAELLLSLGKRNGIFLVSNEDRTLAFDNGVWLAYLDWSGYPVKVNMLGKYSQRF